MPVSSKSLKQYKKKPRQAVVKKRHNKLPHKSKAIPEATHEKWFFSLENTYFVQLAKEWNERNLKINIKMQDDYDQWFNYFKNLSPNKNKMLVSTGKDIIPTEGYAALVRWMDVMNNPARIDKIHQAGLTKKHNADKDAKTIVELSQSNDRLGVLKAIRDQIAMKLEKGAGARDTASLAREMTEIMTQIADYNKRLGPKKNTELGRLLDDMPENLKKRPGKNGGGADNTSFRSRITIEDVQTT